MEGYASSSYSHVPKVLLPLGTDGSSVDHTKAKRATRLEFWCVWPLATLMFVLAIVVHVGTGVVVLAFQPRSSGSAGGVTVPSDATCFRVTRHSDYTTADLIVGSPPTMMRALLRLDRVLDANDATRALRLFSQDAVESKTVSCSLNNWCQDVFVLTNGNRDDHLAHTAEFHYRHGLVEYSLGTTASSISGVVGELFIRKGHSYWLTSTHMCYSTSDAAQTPTEGRVDIAVDDSGQVVANRDDMMSNEVLKSVPVASEFSLECTNHSGGVLMFPEHALVESSWLSISDTGIYNKEPEGVESRRFIAEIGTTCASHMSRFDRDLTLYRLDCNPIDKCRDSLSVPFRRIATSSLFVSVRREGDYWMSLKHDGTLVNLPNLANSTDAFLMSLFKMAMITVAAAVVFIRSKKKTASSSWLFKNCVSISQSKGPLQSESEKPINQAEDRLIGIVAIASRLLVVALRSQSLSQDGQLRVCILEGVGSLLSLVHWVNRWYGLMLDSDEPPVSKLGGSTAVVDSTAAVMLAFSESPTLASSSSQFDPTARMLVSLLVSTIVFTRCAFSAACCGTLWSVFSKISGRMDYAVAHMITAIGWCMQSGILAVTTCDLFVSPAAHSMSRAVVGDSGVLYSMRVALFMGIVSAGLPRLMSTARHITSDKEHND